MADLKVVKFNSKPEEWRDIPGTLRQIADGYEKGEYGDMRVSVVVLAGKGATTVFGIGECNTAMEAVGILELGKTAIICQG